MKKRQRKKYNIELLPIKLPNKEQEHKIEALISQIIQCKEKDSSNDTTTLEKEIDRMIYELYDLTEEEIKIVEEKSKKDCINVQPCLTP